jgi:2-oxo-4-hydroxy-4-carboxy-5-ureidoimidazoline decarboxylase
MTSGGFQQTTLGELNTCTAEVFVERLDGVFENAPWIASQAAGARPFDSVDALHAYMIRTLRQLPETALIALLQGHPELAGSAARAADMTIDSIKEQGALSLHRLSVEDHRRWDRLNAAYGEKFGFPFILCVRRHTNASVLRVFEQRLSNDRPIELEAAIEEIARVSRLRLADRIADHRLPKLHASITVRATDAVTGRPATGMRIALHERAGDMRSLSEASIQPDGRTQPALTPEGPLRIGHYELRAHVGQYFRQAGVAIEELACLDVVCLSLDVQAAELDLQLELALSPGSFMSKVCATQAAGPPKARSTPSGDSEPHAVGERGGFFHGSPRHARQDGT